MRQSDLPTLYYRSPGHNPPLPTTWCGTIRDTSIHLDTCSGLQLIHHKPLTFSSPAPAAPLKDTFPPTNPQSRVADTGQDPPGALTPKANGNSINWATELGHEAAGRWFQAQDPAADLFVTAANGARLGSVVLSRLG